MMFNPAYPFTKDLLESFKAKGVKYFVRSTYKRGLANNIEQAFLISHYHDKPEAERHYNAIPQDVNRVIFDTDNLSDFENLRKETDVSATHIAYSKLIHPENEKKATEKFREHTKRYLHKHTSWDLTGRVTIYPKIYFQLGELYVKISHEGDTITIPFTDLENS